MRIKNIKQKGHNTIDYKQEEKKRKFPLNSFILTK